MFSLHVSRHVPRHVSLHVSLPNDLHVPLYVFLHVLLYVSLHVSLYVSRHDSLSNDLHVSLYVSRHDSLLNDLHVSPSWLSTKKIMQKDNAKAGKISIFSSLDVKLESLTGRVKLTQFSVGSSHVELKIWAIRLESSWKCEQLDPISIRVQNVNSKLDSTISLYRHVMISLYRSSLIYITMYWCSSELAALCKCLSFFSNIVLNCTVLTWKLQDS